MYPNLAAVAAEIAYRHADSAGDYPVASRGLRRWHRPRRTGPHR
jgi:hypothetical protein